MDPAGLTFIQIDAGRIAGITFAKRVADLAAIKNIRFVNHTFTSHLALSASLQSYAAMEQDFICEYPVELKPLAREISVEEILPDQNGFIHVSERPGLGITIEKAALQKYLINVEILVNGRSLYYTPEL